MLKRMIGGILLVALMLGCLCGCELFVSEPMEEKDGAAMVVIAGRHANARMYTEEMVREYVLSQIDDCTTIKKDGDKYVADIKIKVIVSDGDPAECQITYREKPYSLHFERSDPFNLRNDLEDAETVIEEFLMSEDLRADDPEVDLPAAISEAALILRNNPGVKNRIVILDTGIVTAGFADMNELNIQEGTVDEVLDQLSEGAFPDLEDIEVYFYGIGNIATGQTDVTRDTVFQKRLINFWKGYFSRCASESPLKHTLQFAYSQGTEMIHDEESEGGYPKVSNVPFRFSENQIKEPESGEETPAEPLPPMSFNSLELDFKPNSWEFNNEANARKALKGYEETFKALQNSSDKIYVVGSIAKPKPTTDRETSEVSQKRAEAVKNLIESEYGIDAGRIVVIDGGSRVFSWRNAVEFPDGTENSRDTAAMQKNRVVAIIPESVTSAVNELKNYGLIG